MKKRFIVNTDKKRKELGAHVKHLRSVVLSISNTVKLGITRDELSDIIEGLSVKTIGDFERGVVNTKIDSLFRLAQAFNISESELLDPAFSFVAYYYNNEIIIVSKDKSPTIICSKQQYEFYDNHLKLYLKRLEETNKK